MTPNQKNPPIPPPEEDLYENGNKLPFFPLSYGKND
jgi:hypothetical protein